MTRIPVTANPMFDVVMGAIVPPLVDDDRAAEVSARRKAARAALTGKPPPLQTRDQERDDGRVDFRCPYCGDPDPGDSHEPCPEREPETLTGWQEPPALVTVECPRRSCRGYLHSRETDTTPPVHFYRCDACGTEIR
jgi:hypothetical protein